MHTVQPRKPKFIVSENLRSHPKQFLTHPNATEEEKKEKRRRKEGEKKQNESENEKRTRKEKEKIG